MNKVLFFLFLIVISLVYIFEIDQLITKNFHPLNSLKKIYIDNSINLQNKIERYFNQAKTINTLQNENNQLKNYKQLYLASENELNSILEAIGKNKRYSNSITFTNVLSYVGFDDFTKVWIDFEKKDDTILGVISNNYAAGIVIQKGNKAIALLNGNEKCNYSIFIGDEKAPGIIHNSKNRNNILAKFIPIGYNIKIGDEVITSGMDNIFFEGLKVGKVIAIKKMQDMQEAEIKPYANVLKQRHFFIYKKEEILENKPESLTNKKP